MVPVCVTHGKEMRCQKNGYRVLFNGMASYRGDMYQCPIGKEEVVIGFGAPVYQHEANFSSIAELEIRD